MLSESQRKYLELATATYQRDVSEALPYLEGRGLSEQTVRTYRLGLVTPDNVLQGDQEYIGRLCIPYLTTGGPVQVRFRALHPEQQPKYLSKSGAKALLYSSPSLLRADNTVVIVEGEIDAMTWNQCDVPAVGVPGAQNWRDHWRMLFNDFDHVFVVCDGDSAGRDFGKRMAQEIEGAVVIALPDGTDSNDIYVHEGRESLLGKVGL